MFTIKKWKILSILLAASLSSHTYLHAVIQREMCTKCLVESPSDDGQNLMGIYWDFEYILCVNTKDLPEPYHYTFNQKIFYFHLLAASMEVHKSSRECVHCTFTRGNQLNQKKVFLPIKKCSPWEKKLSTSVIQLEASITKGLVAYLGETVV